jgi:phosphohistidine phosphatase SixA
MRRSIVMLLAVALSGSMAIAQPSTVILVRHAEKASQTESDPVLSEVGVRRAKDLAAALADAGVTTVITTQFQRTRLTAAPLVDATKPKTIVVANTGSLATHVADILAAVMARPSGDVVLVVGHSNTIAPIVAALGGPKMANLCDSQYSMMFILEMTGTNPPRLIRANYGAADPVDPACPKTMRAPWTSK